MSTPADPYSILNKDPNRGKIVPKKFVKVNRLWAGKAPVWAEKPDQAELITNSGEQPGIKEGDSHEERRKFKTEIVVESAPTENQPIHDDEDERY